MATGGKGIRPKLNAPYYPESGGKAFFDNPSSDKKLVSDYTGLDFFKIEGLDIFVFWGYLHDSVVWSCNKTANGREYLENAYYYQQTEPDRTELRKKFGR